MQIYAEHTPRRRVGRVHVIAIRGKKGRALSRSAAWEREETSPDP